MAYEDEARSIPTDALMDDPMTSAAAADEPNFLSSGSEEEALLRGPPTDDDHPDGLFDADVAGHLP